MQPLRGCFVVVGGLFFKRVAGVDLQTFDLMSRPDRMARCHCDKLFPEFPPRSNPVMSEILALGLDITGNFNSVQESLDLLPTAAHLTKQPNVVFDCSLEAWMLMTIRNGELPTYFNHAAHERLGFGKPVRVLE